MIYHHPPRAIFSEYRWWTWVKGSQAASSHGSIVSAVGSLCLEPPSVCLLHQHQDCALYYTVHDWMFKSTGCSMVLLVPPSDSYCQLESMTHENNFCNSPPARWPVVLGDEDSRLRWWCHPYPALVWGSPCEPDDDFWGILLSVYFSFLLNLLINANDFL